MGKSKELLEEMNNENSELNFDENYDYYYYKLYNENVSQPEALESD